MIYITGDTHGEQSRFYDRRLLPDGVLTENDYLIVCGDFGYVFRNDTTERLFLDDLEQLPYTVLFVDGNHENFDALYEFPTVEWHGGRVHKVRENILHLMRGEIYEIEGKTFFAMGGAYSIDGYMRTEGFSLWRQALPDKEEYENAAKNLKAHGFKVDYILTHTMPREMVLRFGKNPDAHEMELSGFLEWVMYETDFKHWYCGHWHTDLDLTEKFTILWFDIRTIE